ncbi:Cell cycle serine/threonine-protein kinase cdc5/MSD2 [Mortierella sp. AD031]|nr:Cell cycle serine/threonine-protein kinase cdc5/MSD2 [Mortierella sp. AD031]
MNNNNHTYTNNITQGDPLTPQGRYCLRELGVPRSWLKQTVSLPTRRFRCRAQVLSLAPPATTSEDLLGLDKPTFVDDVHNEVYQEVARLGQGSFGSVMKVIRKRDGGRFALKMLEEEEKETMASNEAELMRTLTRVKEVVQLVTEFQHEGTPCLVLELCPLGDFENLLRIRGKMTVLKGRFYGRQLVAAVAAIHKAGILHRDLKPQNIMVSRGFQLKIGDFGLSATAKMAKDQRGVWGTAGYVAPEILVGKEHTTAMDIWPLGIIMHRMMAKKHAGQDTRNESRSEYFMRVKDSNARKFVKAMLVIDPKYRATARSLVQDEFLTRGYCPRYLDMTAFFQGPPSRAAVVKKSVSRAVEHVVKAMLSVSDAMINFVEPPAAEEGALGLMIGAYPQAVPNPQPKRARPASSSSNNQDTHRHKKTNGKKAKGKQAHTQAARRR